MSEHAPKMFVKEQAGEGSFRLCETTGPGKLDYVVIVASRNKKRLERMAIASNTLADLLAKIESGSNSEAKADAQKHINATARAVVAAWSGGDLARAVNGLRIGLDMLDAATGGQS